MSSVLTGLKSRLEGAGVGTTGALAKGSGVVLLLVLASAAIGFLSQVVLTRYLGVTEYGRYAVALSWALAIAAPAMAGLDASIVRFASRYFAEGHGAQLRRFILFMGCAQLIVIGIAAALVLLTPIRQLALAGFKEGVGTWFVLFIAASAFLGSFSAFFSAFRKFAFSQLYQNILRPIFLMAAIIANGVAGAALLRADYALVATSLTSMIALVLLGVHLLSILRATPALDRPKTEARRWLGFTGWAQLGSVAQLSATQLPVIFLGAFSTPAQAGYFAVATRVSTLVTFGLSAVGTAAAPLISSAHSKEDWRSIAELSRLASRLAFLFAIAASLFFLLVGSQFMSLFGRGFSGAYLPLLILLAGAVFNAFCGVNVILLSMTDRPHFAVWALLAGAAVNVAGSALLTPAYGAAGGAVSVSAGVILSNCIMLVGIRRMLGIDASAVGLRARFAPIEG